MTTEVEPKTLEYYKGQVSESQTAVLQAKSHLDEYLASNQATATPIPVEEFLAGIEERKAVYTKAMSDVQVGTALMVAAEKDQENPIRQAADLKAAEIFKGKDFQTGLAASLKSAELLFTYNKEQDGTFIGSVAMQLGPETVKMFSTLCEDAGYHGHAHTQGVLLKNGPEGFAANSSVSPVRFSGVATPAKTRATSAGKQNGQSGQGWIHPDTKEIHSLGSAFDLVATDAEKDDLQTHQGNNSKQWQIKNKVVYAIGFRQVGKAE